MLFAISLYIEQKGQSRSRIMLRFRLQLRWIDGAASFGSGLKTLALTIKYLYFLSSHSDLQKIQYSPVYCIPLT
jgi:hypothetical protein